jgi:hypothetical protein
MRAHGLCTTLAFLALTWLGVRLASAEELTRAQLADRLRLVRDAVGELGTGESGGEGEGDRAEAEAANLQSLRDELDDLREEAPDLRATADWVEHQLEEGIGERPGPRVEQVRRRLQALALELERDAPEPRSPAARRLREDLHPGAAPSDPAAVSPEQELREILERPAYARRREAAEQEREAREQVSRRVGQGSERLDPEHHRRRPVRRTGPLRDRDSLAPPETGPSGGGWLNRMRGLPGPSPRIIQALLWCLAGLGLAIAVVAVTRALLHRVQGRRRAAKPGGDETRAEEALESGDITVCDPEEFSLTAARLARSGRYREAMRALYLELLGRLYRSGAISYDRTRTNWEYAAQLRARPELRKPFINLTEIFDRVWYGQQPSTHEEYSRCRTHMLDLVEQLPLG